MSADKKEIKDTTTTTDTAVVTKEIGKRTPMYKQRSMGIKTRPGYVRRQVVEKPGRVEAMQAAGWGVICGKDENLKDHRLQSDSQLGSVVREVVNRKEGLTPNAVWMEIPEEYYKEDQAAKQQMSDEKSAAWNPKNIAKANGDLYGADLKIK